MSEQPEALSFGPQWIRDLSNGTNVCVPPPSPGPSYKLAQFRYGKEEMLALFSKDLKPPKINPEIAEFIVVKDIRDPLACIPMSEEEQRNSFGSLNSSAVLKMMGRGGQRGGRGLSRGGRGSGRGRGEGGFYRGFSVEETTSRSEEGWQRETVSKRLSWNENGRTGFGEKHGGSRETDTAARGYDVSAPPVRHKEPSRALSSGNWRSSESGEADDDDGGWIVSGSRGSDKSRGSSRGEWHSQGSREDFRRGSHGSGDRWGDSWNRSRDKNSFDDVPEWSKSDSVFEPESGSFDSSGAFCITKAEKKESKDTEQIDHAAEQKEDWDKELADEAERENYQNESWKVECDVDDKDATRSTNTEKMKEKDEDVQENTTDTQQQAGVKENKLKENKLTTSSQEKKSNSTPPVKEEKAPETKTNRVTPASPKEDRSSPVATSHDQVGADLERVAESCIANLDVEGEDVPSRRVHAESVERPSVVDRLRSSPVEDQPKWFYRDPQGQERGPFSNEEMVEWFHHGYFTMQLQIRRHCDSIYLPLGEVIKSWQRVPFLPGPSPPPVTPQQFMTQQTMLMQQQLLQQHYQQLQKQAILQQIQQQQQQQQHHQQHELHRQHSDSSLHLTVKTSPVDPSLHTGVVSPRSLPTTAQSPSHGGAAEMIWGPEPKSPKGTLSPGSSNASVWDQPNRQKSPVSAVEEADSMKKRLNKEKTKTEADKREAELMALKQNEEEKNRMLKKMEEEERLKQEAIQKQREKDLRLKKQKEEEEEELRREKERRRQELEQQEAERRKEAARQKKEAQEQKQRKESEEQKQKKQNAIREQQKQALLKLQQQQQELHRREKQRREQEQLEQQQERLEQQRQEQEEKNARQLQQYLLQKRAQSSSSSHWGGQNATTLSLSEIQEQEEKNRRAHEEKMRELEARQRQLLSAGAGHGWADRQPSPPTARPLKDIQDEQARQVRAKQAKQAQRAQPAQLSSSGVWSNSWAPGNNNIWSGHSNHALQDELDDQETGFWAEAARAASKTGPTQAQKVSAKQARPSSNQPVANGKKSVRKVNKEEENVRRLFQQSSNNDPFTEWCTQSLAKMDSSVDIPTFIAFLKEVECPYEIRDYVKDFLGESNQAKTFAREFIERRSTQTKQDKRQPGKPTSVAPAAYPVATTKPAVTAANVLPRGGGGANRTQPEPETKDSAGNGKHKKKKKQRMQKVDPSILGFSVNAAERVNMGEIQSVEDS